MGPPVNSAASAFYDWLSVVLGPAVVVFGVLGLVWGHWVGVVLIGTGAVLTWMGWSRLLHFLRSRT